MIDIGFTGTRQGMTPAQLRVVKGILYRVVDGIPPHGDGDLTVDDIAKRFARHGDCVGGDAEFHTLALAFGFSMTLHPGPPSKFSAKCQHAIQVYDSKGYVPRNHDIVDNSHWLIACPKEMEEPKTRRGGGTWATVRYAAGELAEKPPGGARKVLIIYPDGSAERRA